MSDSYLETPKTNTMALISLISGIASIILLILGACLAALYPTTALCACPAALLGVTSLITGLIGSQQIRENPTTQSGKGMAIAGIIIGCITGVLIGLAVLIIGVLALLGPAVGNVFSNIILQI